MCIRDRPTESYNCLERMEPYVNAVQSNYYTSVSFSVIRVTIRQNSIRQDCLCIDRIMRTFEAYSFSITGQECMLTCTVWIHLTQYILLLLTIIGIHTHITQ